MSKPDLNDLASLIEASAARIKRESEAADDESAWRELLAQSRQTVRDLLSEREELIAILKDMQRVAEEMKLKMAQKPPPSASIQLSFPTGRGWANFEMDGFTTNEHAIEVANAIEAAVSPMDRAFVRPKLLEPF